MFESRKQPEKEALKMMQINVVDANGKLNINIKKKGFTPAEALGVLDVAKQQILAQMGMRHNFQQEKKENKE
jgi:hypothetical protein